MVKGFIGFLSILLAGISFCSCTSNSQQQEKRQISKPNIIYILVDDLGYGDLSSYGQTKFSTPHIDKMASEGMRFTQHYAGSSVCAPSRAALITGLHTGHTRVRGNYEIGPKGFGAGVALRPEDITVAEILKGAGYKTGLVGKWGLGVDGTTGEPAKQGFEYMFGFLNQGHAHFHYPEYLWRNGKKVELTGNLNGKREQYAQDLFTEDALKFVEQNKNEPFFLYVAYTVPHAELLHPDDAIFKSFKGKFPETPYVKSSQGKPMDDSLGTYNSQENPRAAYAAMVTRLDQHIGRIMEHLKKLGIDENTIIMFSSDNGPHKEAGSDPVFFNSTGPLRGVKRDLYEGGIRVPFIVRWPGTIKPASISDHVSAFWDFMPTAAELAGASVTETDGISFLPALLGNREEQKQHEYLYWEFHENKTSNQAIRMGDWKGIRHSPSQPMELYNLKTDISEKSDVAAANPEVVAQMEEQLSKVRSSSEIWTLKDR